MRRRFNLSIAPLVVGALAILPAIANAHVYWTNYHTHSIGRANLHGKGINQKFIPTAGSHPTGIAVDAGHIYWANPGADSIARANLDGTGVNRSFISGADNPRGVAVDAGHVYWANWGPGYIGLGTIGRANLNGTGVNQSFIDASVPEGVAVDAGHIYWANAYAIGRANLNGTGVKKSFTAVGTTSFWHPVGVAVDARHLYWAYSDRNFGPGTIGRAKLDGGGVDQSFIRSRGNGNPVGVAVDAGHVYWTIPTPFIVPTTIGRANLDGKGINDEFILAEAEGPNWIAVDALGPPDTKIDSAAINRHKRKAKFRFSSSQRRSALSCKIDRKAYRGCSSPKTYRHLKKGRHTFEVKARNSEGASDPSPAKRRFRI